MGLLEPQHIIFIILLFGTLFGVVGAAIGSGRAIGGTAGFFLGFLLGIIGLIIVLCSSRKTDMMFPGQSVPDQLKKFKDLLDSGAITEDEYNLQKDKLLNQNHN